MSPYPVEPLHLGIDKQGLAIRVTVREGGYCELAFVCELLKHTATGKNRVRQCDPDVARIQLRGWVRVSSISRQQIFQLVDVTLVPSAVVVVVAVG